MANSKVFISYSHNDKVWKDQLLEPLRALERNGHFSVWVDDDIVAGDEFMDEIGEALDSSDAAVLLITNSFLNSEFIHGKELPRILKKHKRDGMRVFPLIVRPCPWPDITWLAKMEVRPDEGRPLARGDEYDIEQDLADFAREVLQSVKSIRIKSEPKARPKPKKRRRAGRGIQVGVVSLESGLKGLRGWLESLSGLQTYFEFRAATVRLPVRAIGEVQGEEQLKIYRLRNTYQMEMIDPGDTDTVGITRHVLAFEDGPKIYYNYLSAPSATDKRLGFMSIANLDVYAQKAGVALRTAFAYVLASYLAAQMADLYYHDTIGCPMDFTESHRDIVKGLKVGRFCEDCDIDIRKKRHGAALLEALNTILAYGRS